MGQHTVNPVVGETNDGYLNVLGWDRTLPPSAGGSVD